MKIKPGYVIKEVSDRFLVIPVGGEAVNFNGIITLNKSGKLLFEALFDEKTEKDLVQVLLDQYEIDEQTAKADVRKFIQTLEEKKLLV